MTVNTSLWANHSHSQLIHHQSLKQIHFQSHHTHTFVFLKLWGHHWHDLWPLNLTLQTVFETVSSLSWLRSDARSHPELPDRCRSWTLRDTMNSGSEVSSCTETQQLMQMFSETSPGGAGSYLKQEPADRTQVWKHLLHSLLFLRKNFTSNKKLNLKLFKLL